MEIIDLSSDGEDIVDLCSHGEDSDSTHMCSDSEDDHDCHDRGSRSRQQPVYSLSTDSSDTSSDEEPIMIEEPIKMDADGFMSTHQASSYRGPAQNRPMPSMTSVIDFEADSSPENPQKCHFTVDEKAVYEDALQHIGQEKGEEDLPEGVLSVSLLKHQKIALAWMVSKENSTHCSGGILADDQGLGKTISTIALIQKERLQQSRFMSKDSECEISAMEVGLAMDAIQSRAVKAQPRRKIRVSSSESTLNPMSRPAAGTLVVCPASVLKQWANELSAKVTRSAELSVLVYHGGSRTRDTTELAEYDVVVTTYSIVALEVPKENTDGEISVGNKMKHKKNTAGKAKKKKKPSKVGPLAMVRWFRVVLDEAHTIKSHQTQTAKACCGLSAERRWCLSGTPIQNNIDDLYSYFRFLKYEPYSKFSAFRSMIKNPVSRNASHGYKKLQTVLRIVLLRRTKEMLLDGEPIIKIPPKTIQMSKIDFTKEERAFYLYLEENSRQKLKGRSKEYMQKNYVHILALLSQLRQACNHPFLLKGKQSFDHSLGLAKELPLDIVANVLENMERGAAKCTMCSKPPKKAVVARCGHVFCCDCVHDKLINNRKVVKKVCPAYPYCGKEISPESLLLAYALKFILWPKLESDATTSCSTAEDQPFSICESSYASSKIRATIDILKSVINRGNDYDAMGSIPSEIGPSKAIVFTQWTGMLDLLEHSLRINHIEFRRLDGSMPLIVRERAVKEFNTDSEVRVIIMSLKAGNLGLNMVAACHVIMLDPWWNPSAEDQAVDRAHRIGQTRPVTVSRLTVKDTVEDRILSLQEGKKKMIQSALGEDQSGGIAATRLTVEDLKYLFKI